MRRHRRLSSAFKRQVADECHAGASFCGPAEATTSAATCSASGLRSMKAARSTRKVDAADTLHECEARIAALDRLAGKHALEIEPMKGLPSRPMAAAVPVPSPATVGSSSTPKGSGASCVSEASCRSGGAASAVTTDSAHGVPIFPGSARDLELRAALRSSGRPPVARRADLVRLEGRDRVGMHERGRGTRHAGPSPLTGPDGLGQAAVGAPPVVRGM